MSQNSRHVYSPDTPAWRRWFTSLSDSARGGVFLVLAAIAAFSLANSPLAPQFAAIWDTPVTIGAGDFGLSKALILWINDGLMALFFLLIGLEIKRELIDGALSSARKAALPVFAAIGGLALPALIYTAINANGGDPNGWAVPAATDIAFALGILAILGKRVPIELKVFLTAVAVVDDLGAILIVAVFLTSKVTLAALGVAAVAMVTLIAFNIRGVRHPIPYTLVGIVLWVAILKSGVHATVAGVMLAATIPGSQLISMPLFLTRTRDLANMAESEDHDDIAPDTALLRIRALSDDVESPLLRWEHTLQPLVLFFIMPIFALANAGVSLGGGDGAGLGTVGWGVALGLVVGKPIGITLGAWLGIKLGFSELPKSLNWSQVHGAAWLGGIGFTMSLFITNLALEGVSATQAKLGLLMASVFAGIVGTVILIKVCPPEPELPSGDSSNQASV